jgi:segregation and condensation protein B
MDYFGINTPEDLPKIKEVFTDQGIDPTVVSETLFGGQVQPDPPEDPEALSVTEQGELIVNKETGDEGEKGRSHS